MRLLWSLAILITALGMAAAQLGWAAGTTGASFLTTAITAPEAAQAAGAAVFDSESAWIWNPAGIGKQPDPIISLTHFSGLVDTAYEQVAGVYPDLWGGTWAGRLFYSATANFVEINALGEEVGTVNNHDFLVQVAHSRSLGMGLSAGAAVKYFGSALTEYSRQGAALDLGLIYQTPWPELTVGASVINAGAMTAYDMETDALPLQWRAGLGLTLPLATGHVVSALADWVQPLAGSDSSSLAVGLRYQLASLLILRAGYRVGEDTLGAFSFGGGLRLAGWGLDYAYQPFSYLGDTHRFTVSYAFLPAAAPVKAMPAKSKPVIAAPKSESQTPRLTLLPEQYTAAVVFMPPAGSGPWSLELVSEDGQTVRTWTGKGTVPKKISWDGLDNRQRPVAREQKWNFRWTRGAKQQYVLPGWAPAWRLQVNRPESVIPDVQFAFTGQPAVKHWAMSIWESKTNRLVYRHEAEGRLPAQWSWTGEDQNGRQADARLSYQSGLEAEYADGWRVLLTEPIRPVNAVWETLSNGRPVLWIRSILFDFNRAELRPEMGDKLLAAAQILIRHNGSTAFCEGHADEIGDEAYNRDLSERRAAMVEDFMTRQPGVNASTVSKKGFGTTRPENKLGTEEGRKRNRRVEIRLTVPEG